MNIPENWTFQSKDVAQGFDSHVREQLPWYDLATRAVAHFGRHYIPKGGLVYDIGASTGNIGRALNDTIIQREARLVAIEESKEMAEQYSGGGELVIASAEDYDFQMYDFAVCFLSIMFFKVSHRREWILKMRTLIKPGGALVVVDKINTPQGYAGTAIRRLAMSWKIESGTSSEDVLKKELSLAGYQRPLNEDMLFNISQKWFQFGEFIGVIIERSE